MRLRIREIRLAKGMTLKDIGDRIGRKPHSVWEYENQKTRVPASILYAIAQTLGVSMNELCTDEDAESPATPLPPPPTPRAALHALPPRRRRGSRAQH
jgi:transcriptional regulator with XRE-family HTH domain